VFSIARLFAVALVTSSLAGCRNPEPAPPSPNSVEPKPIATATSQPEPSTKATPTADAAAPIADPPPPGLYAVTQSDRSNTCPPGDAAPQPVTVTVKPATKGFAATLPVNTAGGSMEIDKTDVLLAVGAVAHTEIQPDRTCSYRITRNVRIQEATPTKIVAEVRSEYGEAVRCTLKRAPVSCARDTVVTYSLVKPLCAAKCTAKTTLLRDGGVDAVCTCP
jgi:hypothetical protein